MNALKLMLVALFVLSVAAPFADADEKDDIKGRLKKRYPTLLRLTNEQKIGEEYTGVAGAVKAEYLSEKAEPNDASSVTIGELLKKENNDRLKLYEILARGRDISAAEVGLLSGKQAFKKAAPNHYLKPKGHGWVLKKNLEQPK